MWLKVLTIVLILTFSKGELINSSAIVSYIHNLLADYETKSTSTHEVAIFNLKKVDSLSDDVDYLFEEICKSIPKSMPLHLSPMQKIVEYRNLRPTSFTVIVSDESNFVSKSTAKLFRIVFRNEYSLVTS